MYPYHLQRVQALVPSKYPPRIHNLFYVFRLLTKLHSFEMAFHTINMYNTYGWNKILFECVNVDYHILGLAILSNKLIVTPDFNFLTNILPLILPTNFSERLEQWCMHNGNPAHFAFNVR